jgi:hypothetical protein
MTPQKSKFPEYLIDLACFIAFGIFSFIIIYNVYGPELLYLKLQPFFAFDPSFFAYYENQNSHVVVLLSHFFLQFMYFPVYGSIIITALLLLLSLIYKMLFRFAGKDFLKGMEFIPALIVLITLKTYAIGLESVLIFLITGIFLLGNRWINDRWWIRLLYQAISLIISFFVFDLLVSCALLIFFVADELFVSGSPGKYIRIPLNIVLLAILVYFVKGTQVTWSIFHETSASNPRMSVAGYWYIILFHVLTIIIIGVFSKQRYFKFNVQLPAIFRQTAFIVILSAFIAIFYSSLFLFDRKYNVEIEHYANSGQWEKVLECKSNVELNDRISRYLLNRAFYYTGKMSDDMFSLPQEWGEHTLLLTMKFNRECTIHNSDLFFDMGFIKGAEYWALESQTNQVYSPRILMRLAYCAILLHDFPLAQKYLNVLGKSPVYKKTAMRMLDKLDESYSERLKKRLIGDKETQYNIGYIDSQNPDRILIEILNEDKDNKMAFEYLMSYYLLRNELGKFYYNFAKHADDMDYTTIPGTYQEALLFFYLGTNTSRDIIVSKINQKILGRFTEFNKTIIKHEMNENMARKELKKNFGNTYWYYVRYESPEITGTSIKKKDL